MINKNKKYQLKIAILLKTNLAITTLTKPQISPISLRSHRSHRDRSSRSHQDCIDRTLGSHRLHWSLSFPIWCRRPLLILIYLSLSLPSSLNLTGFDEFFLVGFCFFCIYLLKNGIIYLFGSWENVRKCEKQVENVFSILFSGTQPNTWKYFPFPKIFSFENILHSENILHPTKRSLNLTRKAIIISTTKLLWKTKEWDVLISWIKRWHKS